MSFDYRQLKNSNGNILRVGDEENDGILRVRLDSGRLLFFSNIEETGNLTRTLTEDEMVANDAYEPVRLNGNCKIYQLKNPKTMRNR